jgi:hypothetical protein
VRYQGGQARSALLAGLLWFSAVQGGLLLVTNYWLPELRDPEYGRRLVQLSRRIGREPRRPFTVVMLGSSRTTVGFRADLLEKHLTGKLERPVVAFNFGLTGAGPLAELLALRRLLAAGVHPDLLVIEVMPPLLSGRVPGGELARLPVSRLWLTDLALLDQYGDPDQNFRSAWFRACPLPCHTQRYALLSRLLPALVPYAQRIDWVYRIDGHGSAPASTRIPTAAERHQQIERTKAEYAGCLASFRLDGTPCRALEELLDTCRREKIAPLLTVMPEQSGFRAAYPQGTWDQVERFLIGLCCRQSAPVILARCWLPDQDFADGHHLLPHGASVFTARLAQQIVVRRP